MKAFLLHADDVLRARPWQAETEPIRIRFFSLVLFVAVFGAIYGAVLGSYGGFTGDRILQVLYSALKVPLLLLATFALSLPSFFVINTLAGLRADFPQALRALVATQAGLTIILASLAPFTAFWYLSCGNYRAAVLFNAFMFGAASLAAQRLLRRFYRPLIDRNPRHRSLLWLWLTIYAFVGIQMGWILRPFVGDPNSPIHFFRREVWGNAYVIIARLFWHLFAG